MKTNEWIKTKQMLEALKNDSDNEQEYTHFLGGILRSTHWLEYDSRKDKYGDSMDWREYDWYTEAEIIDRYAGHWWKREH